MRILDLKEQALCNHYLNSPDEAEAKYPLRLSYCPKCTLVQLEDVLPRELVFGEDFNYLSSSSRSVVSYYKELAEKHQKWFRPQSVLSIGDNDGVYLKNFSCTVLNVDPAPEAVKRARAAGVDSLLGYFEDSEIPFQPSLITAFDVLAHAEKLHPIMQKIVSLMNDSTVLVIQFHSLKAMVERLQWDACYHEHIRTYSLPSLSYLLSMYGLEIFHYEDTEFYGGSTIAYVRKGFPHIVGETVTLAELQTFARRVEAQAEVLHSYLKSLKGRIVGVGSPMKASVLLQYAKIDFLDYLTETNELKIGKYSPGVHLKVEPDSKLLEDQPEYALVLSWNMFDSISQKLRSLGYRGTFLNPNHP